MQFNRVLKPGGKLIMNVTLVDQVCLVNFSCFVCSVSLSNSPLVPLDADECVLGANRASLVGGEWSCLLSRINSRNFSTANDSPSVGCSLCRVPVLFDVIKVATTHDPPFESNPVGVFALSRGPPAPPLHLSPSSAPAPQVKDRYKTRLLTEQSALAMMQG